MRASCSCAAAEPCDASEPSHDCTSPSPPTARGHPRAGSSRRERPPSRRGPTVPRPVSSGTQKTPRVLSHLGAMPCSGSRAILHAATSRPNARPPRRGCSAACGPATSPERPGVGAAARAAPGARGTGTSPGSSGGGRGRRTSSHQTCSPSGSSSASEPEGHAAAVWRREPTSPPPLCSPRPGRVQTRRPPPMQGTAAAKPNPARAQHNHRAVFCGGGPLQPDPDRRGGLTGCPAVAPAAGGRTPCPTRGARGGARVSTHPRAATMTVTPGVSRSSRKDATAKDGRHDRRRGDASGSSRRSARAGGPTTRRVATPRVEPRRREPFEHNSRTASGAAGRPAGGSPGVRPWDGR